MLLPAALATVICLVLTVPLMLKWRLDLGRCVPAVVALSLVAGVFVGLAPDALSGSLAASTAVVCVLTLASAAGIVAYRFFRDPDRPAPASPGVIVSPADGQILYVRVTARGQLPVAAKHGRRHRIEELTGTRLRAEESVVVGIAMSLLDVHVNRSPIAGTVTLRQRSPGTFGSLSRPEMVFENERATTVVEDGRRQVAVVQIASRLVRRIVPFVEEGATVVLGQRIGAIRFGSQVDVVLPAADVRISAAPGDRVTAGTSVIATFRSGDSVADGAAAAGRGAT